MAAITVRNLSDETHRALKARAKAHSRSTEAEVRSILDAATQSSDRVKIGSLLATIAEETTHVELESNRARSEREPLDFT